MNSILSWGKPKIEKCESTAGAPALEPSWAEIDTPVKDTTKLIPKAGAETLAVEEGDEPVDILWGKTQYDFQFELFVKKGTERPFVDNDGRIDGEYAIRLTPEDATCEGIQIDRCRIRVEERYSTAEGKRLLYICKCLKPKSGNTVKPYTQA